MTHEDTEDQRDVELSTLSAIYPEIQTLHEDDPYTFILDLPVNPAKAVTVFFPAAAAGQALDATGAAAAAVGQNGQNGQHGPIESHEVAHLPAIRLRVSLPPSYPAEKPPKVSVSTSPSWLSPTTAKTLENDCARLWEELGRDLIVFSYIDHVQQSADDVFGLLSDTGALEIQPEHKIAVLDYDIETKRRIFDNESFFCGICLDPKRGAKCHRMSDCGHVFCKACLQDYYANAIKEGDLVTVRCLEPGCAKEREAAPPGDTTMRRKRKTYLNPSELLQIGLDQELVKRYVALKYKTWLESDKNVIYCPREKCQGPARSKKHRKPTGLDLHDAEDDIIDESLPVDDPSKPLEDQRLAVCEDCGFAFCSRCNKGWHGEYVICVEDTEHNAKLSAEEKASLEFIALHTSPCPTCACPAQKTSGCNHMICYRCNTHFCYLCSAWLDPANPYQHYNRLPNGRQTSCYMRLWELEDGDEGGNNLFEGGRGAGLRLADQNPRRLPERQPHRAGGPARERAELNGEVAVTQEGPLVLRLGVAAPHPERAPQPAPAARQQPVLPVQIEAGGVLVPARQQELQEPPGERFAEDRRPRGFGWRQHPNAQAQPHQGRARRALAGEIDEQVRIVAGGHDEDQMEDGQAEWVRGFIRLALEDREHLIDEDE